MNCPICKSSLEINIKNEYETWYRCSSCIHNAFIASYYSNGSCRHYYMRHDKYILFGGKEIGFTQFCLYGDEKGKFVKIDFAPFSLEELGDKLADLFELIKFYL